MFQIYVPVFLQIYGKNLKSISNEWDQKRRKKESLVVPSLILSKTF